MLPSLCASELRVTLIIFRRMPYILLNNEADTLIENTRFPERQQLFKLLSRV